MDALELKIYDDRIAAAKFQGYCAGKRVVTNEYLKEKQLQHDNPED